MEKCFFVTVLSSLALLLFSGCTSSAPAQEPEQPTSSASQSEQAAAQPDLSDLDALTKTYLDRLIASGIAGQDWDQPNYMNSNSLVTFYAIHAGEDLKKETMDEFPADEVEAYLRQYFDLDTERLLRNSSCYNQEKNTYEFGGMGSGTDASVTKAALADSLLTLDYDVYSRAEDGTVIWSGTLKIELAPEGGWKYLSNHMQYPLYPLGGDADTLDFMNRTYVQPLNPTGSIMRYNWNTSEPLAADDLFLFLCFNNLLDMERDFEGSYIKNETAPQDEVESAIQRYFDVSAEYLRTSQFYLPDEKSYSMMGGSGGGTWASALNYRGQFGHLEIAVGWYGPDDELNHPRQVARLTIEATSDGAYHYVSYEISPDWPAEPITLSPT